VRLRRRPRIVRNPPRLSAARPAVAGSGSEPVNGNDVVGISTVVAVLGVVEPSVAIDVDVEPNGPSVVVDAGMVVVVVVDSVSVVGETTMDVVVVGSPLEVIDQNSDRNERYVTPLMGKSSHWYRNVIANGPVEGTIRNETFRFTWRQAAQEEAPGRVRERPATTPQVHAFHHPNCRAPRRPPECDAPDDRRGTTRPCASRRPAARLTFIVEP